MISLKDEISKFQKMVYNKQLAEFVTVDQMFVGGGITMESIIHQSNFVVEELKKMNAVFRNYCKLNQKVYTKIMEHQLNVHSQQARLNALASSVDRKIQETLKKIKEIHQDTIIQNQKSHTILHESMEPIKLQLDQKVDLATFTEKMKRFMEDYDEEEEAKGSDAYEERMNNGIQGQPGESGQNSIYPRKKGKVSYDEFYKFRTQLDNILKNSDQKAEVFGKQGIQAKELIIKYIPTINTLLSETNEQKTQIYKLNGVQIEHATQLSTSISKVYSQLSARLNDQVWNSKFDSFFEKQIKPIVVNLQINLKNQRDRMNSYKDESGSKFKQIDSQLLRNKSTITILKKDIQNINIENDKLKQSLKQYLTNQEMQNLRINKCIETISLDLKKKFQQLTKKTQKQHEQLNKNINNLTLTIEQAVMKAVNKRFEKQLKIIQDSIKQSHNMIKNMNNEVGLMTEQIKHIKDLLSQKANFTDIIIHIQKKADKQDFRQLQSKFSETSQHFYTKNLNESINLSKVQKTQSASTRRIPSISRTSKTLLAPQTVNNRTQKLDFDTSTKMFMCGFQNHLTDSRKQSCQNTRRKNMKSSSTAVVGDFVL